MVGEPDLVREPFWSVSAEVRARKLTGESVDGELQGIRSARGAFAAPESEETETAGASRIEFLEDRRLLSGRRRHDDSRAALDADGHEPVRRPERPDGQPGRRARSTSTRRTSRAAATRRSSRPNSPRSNSRTGWSGCRSRAWAATSASSSRQLTDVGMQITATSSYYGLVDGFAPINELPTIAELPQTLSGQADYYPIVYAGVSGRSVQRGRDLDVRRRRPHRVQRRRNRRHDRRALGQRQSVRRADCRSRTAPAT